MNKKVTRWGVLFVVLASATVFARTLLGAMFYDPETEIPALPRSSTEVSTERALPSRLIIPSLDISAAVEHVGINYRGNMASPADYDNVAWYEQGTIPGSVGSAVMAGHLNDGLGLSGVFQNLQKISPGDEVLVEDEEGKRIRFVVDRIETYDYREVPLDRLFESSDGVRLNLITCAGRWTWDGETYDKRFVVYTKMVEQTLHKV